MASSQTPLADELARISRDEFDRYIKDFRPTEKKVISEIGSSTVGSAMDDSQSQAVRSRAALERMRGRYGAETTPMQAAAEARTNALSGVLNTTNAGNVAVLADKDRKTQSLAGALNQGQALRQQALGNFGSAASMEGQRASANASNNAAYKQQQSQNKAAMYGQVASLAGTAAMVMMM